MARCHLDVVISCSYVVLCVVLLCVGAQAQGTIDGGSVMKESYQDAYCWCNTTSKCTPLCDRKLTCNNNGDCEKGDTCKCDTHFAGKFCDRCEGNRASKNESKLTCDICKPNFYTKTCGVYCVDSRCGHGKCHNVTGRCVCDKGWGGGECNTCDTNAKYYTAPSGCEYCDDKINCTGNGWCLPRRSGSDPVCHCPPPYTGLKCNECLNKNYSMPNCGLNPPKSKADKADCPPPNLMLPVVLAIVASMVVIGGLLGAYMYVSSKSKSMGAANKGFNDDNDFNRYDDSHDAASSRDQSRSNYDHI